MADDAAPRAGEQRPSLMDRMRRLGPGLLVAAAFIGPGTVTTASVAGADYGFALVWALVFSVVACIVLQDMSARLGLVTREGLGEAMHSTFRNPAVSWAASLLVVAAIGFGNAAFEAGNITGAALGLNALTGVSPQLWSLLVGVGAFALLASGVYRFIERALVTLVVLMGVVFVVTAFMVRPDFGALFGGFVPTIPTGATLTVIALIGTTVVPYNLFLHASSVQAKWPESVPAERALVEARTDTIASISLGGLVTLAIVSTAAAAFFATGTSVEDAGDMAVQLEPLLGTVAQVFFSIGLLAAGLTSAVTAPLAAAFATSGAMGWKRDLKSLRFRAVWAVIIVIGTAFAVLGRSPVEAIVFAQAANGLLLPIIAVFLIVVMNRADLLGSHRNGLAANVAGGVVVLVAVGLGVFQLLSVFGVVDA